MHLGQFAMGAAGLVIIEATGVSPEARITSGCLGLWSDENEQRARARSRLLWPLRCRQDGHPTRPCRAQGVDPGSPEGRAAHDCRGGRLADRRPVCPSLRVRLARTGRARCHRPGQDRARLRAGDASCRAPRARARRAAHGARLPHASVPLAFEQSGGRTSTAAASRTACGCPLRVFAAVRQAWPERPTAGRARLRERLGRGRLEPRGDDRARQAPRCAGLRLYRRLVRRPAPRPEDQARARLPDAVCPGGQAGGPDGRDGGGAHHRSHAGRGDRGRGRCGHGGAGAGHDG